MAGKDYKYKDIINSDVEAGLKKLAKLTTEIHKSLTTIKVAPSSGDGLKDMNKELKKTTDYTKSLDKINKERLKTEKQQIAINKNKLTEANKLNLAYQKELAVTREKQAAIRKEAKAYVVLKNEKKEIEKLSRKEIKSDKELIRYNNLLTRSRANLTKNTAKNRKEYSRLTKEIVRNEKAIRNNDKSIGRFQRNVGNYAGGIKNLASSFGLLGGAMIAVNVIKNAFKIFTEFSKENSKLAAILGKSKNEIIGLTSQAKKLGAVTAFTASQITQLHIELAKLGFSQEQIEASTEGIQSLAAATGVELSEAATLAGSALKIFGLDASEAGRVSDVLALSTSKSALDMEKLATALPYVGTSAKTAGRSIEWTTARLGILTDRGLQASTAGTSLRKMFGELAKKGITYNDALEQINTSTNKSKTAIELFGLKAKDAAIILAENVDVTNDLEEALIGADGAAKNMADTMLDNLAGNITLATSAWEGFILSIESGDGVISKVVSGAVLMFTNLLNKLTQLNEYGTIIDKKDADVAQKRIDKWKETIKYSGILFKQKKRDLFLLRLEEEIYEQKQKLANDEFTYDGKRRIATEKKIKLLEREKQIIYDLQKTGFFGKKTDATPFSPDEKKKDGDEPTKGGSATLDGSAKYWDELLKLEEKYIRDRESLQISSKTKKTVSGLIELDPQNEMAQYALSAKQLEDMMTNYNKSWLDRMKDAFNEGGVSGVVGALFNVSNEDAEKIMAQVQQIYGEVMNIMQEAINQEKAINDEKLALADERISKAQEELTTEEERIAKLNEIGAAYDLSKKQRLENELKEQLKIKNKALAEDKKIKQKQKALAITTAVINTAGGVLQALGAYPPPYNFVLAAITAALGAVQIAQISSAKYAEGTNYVSLDGNKPGRDTVPAMLDAGERVVPKSDNAKIPLTFPNSELPAAINYYMNRNNVPNGGANIVNVGNNDVYLSKIEKNTRENGKVYSNGRLIQEKRGLSTIRYN